MLKTMGLHHVSADDLRRLVRAVYRGQLSCPVTRAGLVLAQFGDLEGHLDGLIGRDRAAVLALVQAVLMEREAATGGRATAATELLWRGPFPAGSACREPLELVGEWLAQATESVLWAGIPAAARHRLFQTLHAAQRGRDLAVRLIVIGRREAAQRFIIENFNHGTPLPNCAHADPDGVVPPACLIIDGKQALLFQSSADLLDEAESTLLRSAVASHDPAFAATLSEHVHHLVESVPYANLQS